MSWLVKLFSIKAKSSADKSDSKSTTTKSVKFNELINSAKSILTKKD